MIAYILKELKVNALSYGFIAALLVLLMVITLPNIEKVKGMFGFDTKATLTTKLEQANQTNKEILVVNEANYESIIILDKVNKNIVDSFNNQLKDIRSGETIAQGIIIVKQAEIQKVKISKPPIVKSAPIRIAAAIEAPRVKAISKIQITSIWKAFCESTDDAECATNTHQV